MDIRHLETFVQVAKLNSFSKAAKHLGYSQAAITIQIRQLEEELQTNLFERFHKTISLTDQGSLFLTHAIEILEAVNVAKKCTSEEGQITGTLRIGTIESLCTSIFPSLIQAYHQAYPHVHIIITTGSPKELLEQLNHNQLDLVYFMDELYYDVNWIKVMETKEPIVFVCAPTHPIVQKASLSLQDILQEDLVLTEKNASYRASLEQCLAKKGLMLQPTLEIGNTDFIIDMIEHHFGVSFLPHVAVAPYLEQGRLIELHPKDVSIEIWRQLVYHKHKWLTSQMQAFIKYATKK